MTLARDEGMSSYEKINYAVRPAKNIERKMFCEGLLRLRAFASIDSYLYVGFGSVWFSDFIAFHKSLGISNMVSIESDDHNQKRFEFNRPYGFIKMRFGLSHDVLPELQWDTNPAVLWLDYDSRLNASMLADIYTFCGSCLPGSILIVTVETKPYDLDADNPQVDVEMLTKDIGRDNVPVGVSAPDLRPVSGLARVCRDVINTKITDTLSARNGGLGPDETLEYTQVFHFLYNDGTPMLTVGGVVCNPTQAETMRQGLFDGLDFVRSGEDPYLIDVPKLTFREVRQLDALLGEDALATTEIGLNDEVIRKYHLLHRYFPTFTEVEI